MAERNLIGFDNDQVSLNGMLGSMAFQDSDKIEVGDVSTDLLSGKLTVGEINHELLNIGIRLFVYDTRKDSDGGKWRKTTAASWYNEDLNTKQRGSKREFPAVAILVATWTEFFIFDGDDPSCPLWMKFDNDSDTGSGEPMLMQDSESGAHSLVDAKDGKIITGHRSGSSHNGGIVVVDFVRDNALKYRSGTGVSFSGYFRGNISERNLDKGWTGGDDQGQTTLGNFITGAIIHVPKNSDIDPETGLPKYMLFVTGYGATNGGDGPTVITESMGSTPYGRLVGFWNNTTFYSKYPQIYKDKYFLFASDNSSQVKWITFHEIPQDVRDFGYSDNRANWYVNYLDATRGSSDKIMATPTPVGVRVETIRVGSGTTLKVMRLCGDYVAMGSKFGVGIGTLEETNPRMANYITTDYNTGWVPNDPKAVLCCSTSEEDLVGSGELITNGVDWTGASGTTPPTGWSCASSVTTFSVSSGQLTIDRGGEGSGTNARFQQTISVTSGKVYTISFDLLATSHGAILDVRHSSYGGYDYGNALDDGSYDSTTGRKTFSFRADASSVEISLRSSSINGTMTIDNFSVQLADEDRSVYSRGPWVNGTITRTPVAEGAELVSYSGFSGSNYLKLPTSDGFDLGTGDFFVSCWVKNNVSNGSSDYVVSNTIQGSNTNPRWGIKADTTQIAFNVSGSAVLILDSNAGNTNDEWRHVAFCRRDGILTGYLDGVQEAQAHVTTDLTLADSYFFVGSWGSSLSQFNYYGEVALVKLCRQVPTRKQIMKMFVDEKRMFAPNAKCTLYGTSDDVVDIAYDDSRDLIQIGTSSGRSDFLGMCRINNSTTEITVERGMSSSNGFTIET